VFKTTDSAEIDAMIALATGSNINLVQNTALPSTITEDDVTLLEPYMTASSILDYTYSYNDSATDHYRKAKIVVSYDDSTRRFSIKPEKHTDFRTTGGAAVTSETFPFYKNLTHFGRTSKLSNLDSYLEIPNKDDDKNSINYKIGARDKVQNYIALSDLSSNTALIMPHIPKLILYPYLFLTCDFVASSMKSGVNRSNIIQKLPLTSEYGNINYFNVSSTDSSAFSRVSRDNIQNMRFSVVDNNNNVIDLNGGELSFTLNFEY
jgi:hypothetical protein